MSSLRFRKRWLWVFVPLFGISWAVGTARCPDIHPCPPFWKILILGVVQGAAIAGLAWGTRRASLRLARDATLRQRMAARLLGWSYFPLSCVAAGLLFIAWVKMLAYPPFRLFPPLPVYPGAQYVWTDMDARGRSWVQYETDAPLETVAAWYEEQGRKTIGRLTWRVRSRNAQEVRFTVLLDGAEYSHLWARRKFDGRHTRIHLPTDDTGG